MVISNIPLSVNTSQTLDLNNDTYIVSGLTGNITLTLPDVFTTIIDGAHFYIIRADTTSNTLTVAPNSASGNSISGGIPNITLSGRIRLKLISLNGVWYGTQTDSSSQETKNGSTGGNLNTGIQYLGTNAQTTTNQAAGIMAPRAMTILSFTGTMNTAIVGTGSITMDLVLYAGSDYTLSGTVIGTKTLNSSDLGSPVVQWTGTVSAPNIAQYDAIVIRANRSATGTGTASKRINVTLDLL